MYILNFSASEIADAYNNLDELYHTKGALDEYKPDDYRIGSMNALQADINQLGRLIIYNNINLARLRDAKLSTKEGLKKALITKEELDKALTVSINHSGLSDIEFYYLYLYIHRYRFPDEAWSRISGWKGIAENEPELAEMILEGSIKVQQRSLTTSGSFPQWTHSFRSTLGNTWLFERFLKQVNGLEATGKKWRDLPYAYRKFSPSMPEYNKRGITIHDFPGPGVVIYGLHSPLFPKNYIETRFYGILHAGGAAEMIDADYRDLIVKGENHLNKTIFAFFRGLVLIYNPEIMKVNNKPCGLLVFNDHFPHDHIKTSYLVSGRVIEKFLKDPFLAVGEDNIFHPNLFEHRSELKNGFIKLVSIAATAGMCEEYPNYDKEKYSVNGRRYLHEKIKNASIFGFTQLDLLREAYRLHLLGYYYNKQRNSFYMDEFVMLRELLRINKQASQKIDEITPGLPVAFPFTFFEHSIDEQMVRDTGFVGANMVIYKNNSKGDCMLFPSTIGSIEPDDIDNLSIEKITELIGGNEEYDKWADFREACEYHPANPLIVDPIYKRIGSNIIRSSSS